MNNISLTFLKQFIIWIILGYITAFLRYKVVVSTKEIEIILTHFSWLELVVRVLIFVPLIPLALGWIVKRFNKKSVLENATFIAKIFFILSSLNILIKLISIF